MSNVILTEMTEFLGNAAVEVGNNAMYHPVGDAPGEDLARCRTGLAVL